MIVDDCGWVGIHLTLARLMMFDDVSSVFSIGLHRFAIDRSTMPLVLCRLSFFWGLAWISHIHMVQSPAHQLGQEWAKSFGKTLRETALLSFQHCWFPGVGNCPMTWVYWTSPYNSYYRPYTDHGWVMWNMGTFNDPWFQRSHVQMKLVMIQ